MMFVFISSNIIFFFIAWEAMALISYFLVIFESDQKETRKAGLLYIVMTHIATAFLLTGFLIAYSYTKSFDIFASSAAIPHDVKNIIFILFVIGFGTKAGVIPLHIWLPYAHPAAPSNVSALMSGIMIKTAIYGLVRFVLGYLGVESTWWGAAILCIGAISAVLGVLYALMDNNIKRLLAYSSIENMGIIMIGLGASFIMFAKGNAVLGSLALIASLLHAFNHTLFKGGLFLGAGSIQYSTHTKDIEKLGGLIKKIPVTAFFVLCFALAISAIVPFNGFISEWLTYQSLFAGLAAGQTGLNILSVISIAALGMAGALAAACFVKLFGISFLGLPRSENSLKAEKVPVPMNIGMGLLASLCLIIGLFPMTILKLLDNVVSGLSRASVFRDIQGGLVIAYYPLKIEQSSISSLALLITLAVLILLTLLLIRIFGGRYIERKYGTWDCGYKALNSRMQYSATGFSKPMNIVFKILFRPLRETHVTGRTPYHPDSIEYEVSSTHIFEKFIYKPIYEKVTKFSKKIKYTVQTGSIHSYLLYIFVTIVILMAYNIFA
jgi:formate hydrogenlyase subunit 3/multisubunit Na+/H+ antiporter MnhD subunit